MLGPIEDHDTKAFRHEKGVTYFTRRFERTLFFILTLGMLVWGVAEGIFNTGS